MWFKTHSVQLGDGRTVYLAWDETHCATAMDADSALTELAAKSIPEGYVATWHQGGIDADDFWVVSREDTPGVRGMCGTPELAVEDFEKEKRTRWHPKRFSSMAERVLSSLDRPCHAGIAMEFSRLIQDIRSGTFKYEG